MLTEKGFFSQSVAVVRGDREDLVKRNVLSVTRLCKLVARGGAPRHPAIDRWDGEATVLGVAPRDSGSGRLPIWIAKTCQPLLWRPDCCRGNQAMPVSTSSSATCMPLMPPEMQQLFWRRTQFGYGNSSSRNAGRDSSRRAEPPPEGLSERKTDKAQGVDPRTCVPGCIVCA